ncbi:MAG: radical SAM protein [Candidatus Brocadiae bacterium]|nr:radical SAM protein [Candidatus Brocadiia bacterium]
MSEPPLKDYQLASSFTYGPVNSRRCGVSLGLNTLPPDIKVCSFDCPYCQCGWTAKTAEGRGEGMRYPAVPEILGEIERRLAELAAAGVRIDTMTFAGNGEPTLHPRFREIVEGTMALRDRHQPGAIVDVLSNAQTVNRPAVREGLRRLDRRIMKLDGGNMRVIEAVDRPLARFDLPEILEGLRTLGDVTIQSMFVTGSVDNTAEADVDDWVRCLDAVRPVAVQVYTLDRGPADPGLRRVPAARLEEIAARARAAGHRVEVF